MSTFRSQAPGTEFKARELENITPISTSRGSVWPHVNKPWCLVVSERILSVEPGKDQSERPCLSVCVCVGGEVLKSFLYLNARNPASSVLFIEGFFLTLVLGKITFSEHSYNCPVWESYTLEILQRHVVLEGIWRCSSLLLLLFLLHLHISITNIIILHCVNEAPYFLKVSSLHFSYHRNSGDKPVGIE